MPVYTSFAYVVFVVSIKCFIFVYYMPMSIISSVDLTLDAPYILVSCKQRIEILLSRQYCIAFIVQGDAIVVDVMRVI